MYRVVTDANLCVRECVRYGNTTQCSCGLLHHQSQTKHSTEVDRAKRSKVFLVLFTIYCVRLCVCVCVRVWVFSGNENRKTEMSSRSRTLLTVNLDAVMANDPLRELFEACKTGDIVKVKKLINSQTVNARDTAGRKSTPLHFAAGELFIFIFLPFPFGIDLPLLYVIYPSDRCVTSDFRAKRRRSKRASCAIRMCDAY